MIESEAEMDGMARTNIRARAQVWVLMTVCIAGLLTLFATAVAAALAA